MKKLNRKGFTLVELLAVIVILAIVIGITIPAITSTINSSKNSSLKSVLDNAENWITQQYSLYNTNNNDDTVSDAFKNSISDLETTNGIEISSTTANNVIIASGISAKNFTKARAYLNPDTGRACVIMTEIPESSQYFNTKIWTVDADTKAATPKTTGEDNTLVGGDYLFSKSCTQTTDITKAQA